jgi:molybdopterin-guanine dinucleotide biosynthesis protein MobB
VADTRIVAIVGRKHAGKTTLTAALAAALGQRGLRTMTIKHGHHLVDVDREGTDSWRHFHEGRAERTLLVSPDLRVLFERSPDEYDPIGLARRYLEGADVILVEGFKRAPLPKIEVYRAAAGGGPLYDRAAPNAGEWIALLADDTPLEADCPVLRLADPEWLPRLAALALDGALVLGPEPEPSP